jgi:hypothetical protein
MATTIDTPKVLETPFASQGDFNEVPQTNDQTQGLVSVAYGFPPITSLSVATEGGIPPKRRDMNGALNLLSTHNFHSQNGGIYTFNQDVSDAIGGYAKGAVLGYVDSNGDYFNLVSLKNNNTANFNTNPSYIGDGVNWKKISTDKYMTNCLLDFPHNAKIEINNGTLTVKAGTVGYLKNGNTITLSQDVSQTITTSDGYYFVFITSPTTISLGLTTSITYEDLPGGLTLPICVVKATGGTITSIENVFNGIGYIGSTVFVLPNVVGIAPKGRNADGSLKNKLVKTQNIAVFTEGDYTQHQYQFVLSNGTALTVSADYDYIYDKENNLITRNNGQIIDGFVISECDLNGGVISNFNSNKVFQALDYNYLPYLWSATMAKTSDYSPSVVVGEGEGYIKFSSGVMIQWGVSTSNPIVFPQPFINTNYSVTYLSYAQVSDRTFSINNNGKTTTSVDIYQWITGSSWQAIGKWK